jgi:glucose/arabinose dehydrogenase
MIGRTVSMPRLLFVTLVAATAIVGCGGSSSPPTSSPPPSGSGETITGRERVGWLQTAASEGDLSLFAYALYVDGNRRVLVGASCAPPPTAGAFNCSAPLPQLSTGTHTLELASFVVQGESVIESGRSAALRVTVASVMAPADPADVQGGIIVSSDGLRLQVDVLASDLHDPVDIASAGDGRLFVAERTGRIRVFDPAASVLEARADRLRLPGDPESARLVSLALAPDFDRSGGVYVAYVVPERDGAVLRVARFRERGGLLAQAAVLTSHAVAPDASAVTRFGPDGHLYIGVGAASSPDDAQNLAAAGGKILRLTADGRTPGDNPWPSPVFSLGHRNPSGLAWSPRTNALWEVEPGDDGDEINEVRAGANHGWPLGRGSGPARSFTPPVLLLPPGTEASGAATLGTAGHPLAGDLLVSAAAGEDLVRIRFDEDGRYLGAARLLQRRFGRLAQVSTTPAGLVHAVTANGGMWGTGRDLLLQLTVAEEADR